MPLWEKCWVKSICLDFFVCVHIKIFLNKKSVRRSLLNSFLKLTLCQKATTIKIPTKSWSTDQKIWNISSLGLEDMKYSLRLQTWNTLLNNLQISILTVWFTWIFPTFVKHYLLQNTQWNHLLTSLPLACWLFMVQDGLLAASVPLHLAQCLALV